MAVLFASLGTRDLKPKKDAFIKAIERVNSEHRIHSDWIKEDRIYKGEFVFTPMRLASEKIKSSITSVPDSPYLNAVYYPILKPAISYALSKANGKLDEIILFPTDQSSDPDVQPHHTNGDTIHLVPIMESLIRRDFSDKIGKIRYVPIERNPNLLSEVYNSLSDSLESNLYSFEGKRVYLINQGGIDGANLALLLLCIEKYPDLVQLFKPDGMEKAVESNTHKKFKENYSKHRIFGNLEKYDYYSVLQNAYSDRVKKLAFFAYCCLNFDFDKAEETIETLCEIDQSNIQFYIRLSKKLSDLNKNLEPRFENTFLSAKIKYKQGAYADFLFRIFTLTERILIPYIIGLLGIEEELDTRNQPKEKWEDYLVLQQGSNENLLDFLKNKKYNNKPLRYKAPSILTCYSILQWEKQEFEKEHPYLAIHPKVNALRRLRNKVAHNLEGVPPDEIEAELLRLINVQFDSDDEFPATKYFLKEFDDFLKVKGMGMYDMINERILMML